MPDSLDDDYSIIVNLQEDEDNEDAQHVSQVEDDGNGIFSKLVNNILDDMKKIGQVHASIHDSNEQIKAAHDAPTMKDLRARLNADLQSLLTLANQINRKFGGLVAANAAQRRRQRRPGSDDGDKARATMIADLIDNLKHMMRDFQGLRMQMETDHRQLIENRYFAITKEKATAESIDNLIASVVEPGNPIYQAIQEHGGAAVADAVAEIEVRRDTTREVRQNLMSLHQIFLGITTPVPAAEGQTGGGCCLNKNGGATPSPRVDINASSASASAAGALAKLTGTGGLNDYEKKMRRQAYIAIAIAVVVLLTIIILLLRFENKLENGDN